MPPAGRCEFFVIHFSGIEEDIKLADVMKENVLLFCTINCRFVSAFTYFVSLRYFSVGILDQTELDPTEYSPMS
jgi:hypothetical protein